MIYDYFSYRCKYRKICKILLKISKSEQIKLEKDHNYKIKYEITSIENAHSFKNNKKNSKELQNNKSNEIEIKKQKKNI